MIGKYLQKIFSPPPYIIPPYTLNRKQIYILPTRHGLMFLVVLTAMLLGSVNYNNNMGFLLTFLLGSMTFVSMLHTHKNMSGIQITSATARPAFAGENAVFQILIHAQAQARPAIGIQFSKNQEVFHTIEPDRDNPLEIGCPALKRGVFKPGPMTIFTRYPLGLFRSWSTFDLGLECPIYPKPIYGPLMSGDGAAQSGQDTGQSAGPGVDDFDGLRSYLPGDPLRHISWKSLSKGQGVLTKEFIGQAGSSVLLDWDAFKEGDTEHRLSRLCGMVLAASSLDIAYGLKLPGKSIELDKGEAHKHTCLRTLALFGEAA
jgi:uncharacterized protein (DUF58 family)